MLGIQGTEDSGGHSEGLSEEAVRKQMGSAMQSTFKRDPYHKRGTGKDLLVCGKKYF